MAARPFKYNMTGYIGAAFRRQFVSTLDISANTYTASIKNIGTNTVVASFVVTHDANNVILTLTELEQTAIPAGDYYYDILEKTPTIVDGTYVIAGRYSLVYGAT